MKKFCIYFFGFIYIFICLFVTICLLHFNDYNVSVFKSTLVAVINEDYKDVSSGSLAIIKNGSINKDDQVFYYDKVDNKTTIKLSNIEKIDKSNEFQTLYILEDEKIVDKETILGTLDNSLIIPVIGSILSVLESKWGFLLIIILPFFLLFIFEIHTLIKEFKKEKKKRKKHEVSKTK